MLDRVSEQHELHGHEAWLEVVLLQPPLQELLQRRERRELFVDPAPLVRHELSVAGQALAVED
eukprot:758242-Hanusia_phi.AAC.7